jgi:threonine synthase
MDLTPAFNGLSCTDCGERFDPAAATHRCPACDGRLRARYDYEASAFSTATLDDRRFDGIGRYDALLPFPSSALVSAGAGATPLISCPAFADELGVDAVYVKDEGCNPTGSVADRALAVGVTAADQHDADAVALSTTGDDGQSASAYAARAGLPAHPFVPARSTFVAKAMTNVHGGEMSVVRGRYPDAREAYEDAMADHGPESEEPWYSLAPFDSPYRLEGAKTLLFEVCEQLEWTAPDAVVHPTGHGAGLAGSHRALEDLAAVGGLDEHPSLYAAQPEDCAPVVDAWEDGADATTEWEHPDTLIGRLEVPDPEGGALALDVLAATDGGAVAVEDDAALENAISLAREGVSLSATGGVAAAAAATLAKTDTLGADDTVVLVNPVDGNKENDVLRSHLMRA